MTAEIRKHIELLTAISPYRNWTNANSLLKAKTYIADEFMSYGLTVNFQKWPVGQLEFENVIANYQPQKEAKLIIGAHYDVFSNQPGADDNTSGVAGLLWLANKIGRLQPQLPYGIEFVSYCLEEPPNFGTKNMGSYVHAKNLKDEKTPVVGMICLDMIGYFSEEENSQSYPIPELAKIYPTKGNFIGVIGITKFESFSKIIADRMKEKNTIPVELINFPSNANLAGLSDHRNYWHFGYDAVMINDTAKYRNPNYHEITDTIDTLDLTQMQGVLEALLFAIQHPFKHEPKLGKTPTDTSTDPPASKFPNTNKIGVLAQLIKWLKMLFQK